MFGHILSHIKNWLQLVIIFYFKLHAEVTAISFTSSHLKNYVDKNLQPFEKVFAAVHPSSI